MLQSCSNQRIRKSKRLQADSFPWISAEVGEGSKTVGRDDVSPKDEKSNLALFGSFQFNLKIKIESKDREMCDL